MSNWFKKLQNLCIQCTALKSCAIFILFWLICVCGNAQDNHTITIGIVAMQNKTVKITGPGVNITESINRSPQMITYTTSAVPYYIHIQEVGTSNSKSYVKSDYGWGWSSWGNGNSTMVDAREHYSFTVNNRIICTGANEQLSLSVEGYDAAKNIRVYVNDEPKEAGALILSLSPAGTITFDYNDINRAAFLNKELYININQSTGMLSDWESGFYILSSPSVTFTNKKQPTCNGVDDGSIDVIIPTNNEGISYFLTVAKYTDKDTGSPPRTSITNGNDYYFEDGITIADEAQYSEVNQSRITINNKYISDAHAAFGADGEPFKMGSGMYVMGLKLRTGGNSDVCIYEHEFFITQPEPVVIGSFSVTDSITAATPPALPDGTYQASGTTGAWTAKLGVTGGTGSYRKVGGTTNLSNIGGKYIYEGTGASKDGQSHVIKIEDTNGCKETTEPPVSIKCPSPILITKTETPSDYICDGSSTSFKYKVEGGVGPFNANLTKGGVNVTDYTDLTINDREERTVSGLEEGIYVLTIKDNHSTQNNKSETYEFTVSKRNNPTFTATPNATSYCNNIGNDGSIDLSNLSGHGSLYEYAYRLGTTGGFSTNTSIISTATISNKSAGTYQVKVTNSGCSTTKSVTIDQRAVPSIGVNGSLTDHICERLGSASFEISGHKTGENYKVEIFNSNNVLIKSNTGNNLPNAVAFTSSFSENIPSTPSGLNYYAKVSVGDSNKGCVNNSTTFTIKGQTNDRSLEVKDEIQPLCTNLESGTDKSGKFKLHLNNGVLDDSGNYQLSINNGSYSNYRPNDFISGFSGNENLKLMVKDKYGCVATINNYKLGVAPNQLAFKGGYPSSSNSSCLEGTDGSITVEVVGGKKSDRNTTTKYSYSFTKSDYTGTLNYNENGKIVNFSNKKVGNYVIRVKDEAGCYIRQDISISNNPNPLSSFTLSSTDEHCDASDDGEISISELPTSWDGNLSFDLVGYTNGYTKLSETSGGFKKLNHGNYTVKISHNTNGCSNEKSVTVGNDYLAPTFTPITNTSLACESADNGVLSLTINTNSYPTITFSTFELLDESEDVVNSIISDTGLSRIYNQLNNQNYQVHIVDEFKCSSKIPVTIELNPNSIKPATTDPFINMKASCVAAQNAKINVQAEGGVPYSGGAYWYHLIEGTDTVKIQGVDAQFANLPVGNNYKLEAMDVEGCRTIIVEDIKTLVVTDSMNISAISDLIHPNCHNASTGSIVPQVINTDDSLSYNYTINSGSYVVNNQSFNREDLRIENLPHGNYELSVQSSDGCSTSYPNIFLNNPDTFKIIDSYHNYIRVKDETTGRYGITVEEGNQKYNYQWLNEAGDIIYDAKFGYTNSYDTTFVIDNQPAGTYTFKIQDTAQCNYYGEWYTETIHIEEPLYTLGLQNEKVTDVSCNKLEDGAIYVEGYGGWGDAKDYLYSLDTINTGWSSFHNFDKKIAGNYTVYLKDTAQVVYKEVFTIDQPDTLDVFIDDYFKASCPNYLDGWVKASVSNDIRYTDFLNYVVLDAKNDTVVKTDSKEDTYFYNQLNKGDYQLVVRDNNECVASKPFRIEEPDTAKIALNNNYIIKKGDDTGWINGSVIKGNEFFDFRWLSKGDFNPIIEGQTNSALLIEKLDAGDYILEVRDTAGCVYEDEEWMRREISIVEPDLALSFDTTQLIAPTCNGLSDADFKIQGKGGWGDYIYVLNEDTVVDGVFAGLTAGDYQLIVMDSVDVKHEQNITITEPDVLVASIRDTKDIDCYEGNDGYIILNILGGNADYKVSVDETNWFMGDSVPDLTAGLYDVFVKDKLGCETQQNNITLTQESELVQTFNDIIKSRCSKDVGEIKSAYTGGVFPYAYTWQKDTVFADNSTQILDLDYSTPNISQLYSSRYFLEVRDAHNCPYHFEFLLGDITNLSIDSIQVKDVDCFAYADGQAKAFVSLGNPRDEEPKYNYSWAKEVSVSKNDSAWAMETGVYSLLVRDTLGCAVAKEFTIGTPDDLNYKVNKIVQPLCLGGEKGALDLEATGGTAPYNYLWSTGNNTNVLTQVDEASYWLEVLDSHNCYARFNYDFTYQKTALPFVGNDTLICHYNSLAIDAGNYDKFQWTSNNGFTSRKQYIDITEPDTYYLQVADEDACIGFDTLLVDVSYLKIDSSRSNDITCNSDADGSAQIQVSPMDWKHYVSWSNGANTYAIDGIGGGDYNVRVFDDYGCEDTEHFSIYEPEPLSVSNTTLVPLCFGVPNGEIKVSAEGGRAPYQYQWLQGDDDDKINRLDTGVYVLDVYDKMNCHISKEYKLLYETTIYPQLGEDKIVCIDNDVRLYPGKYEDYKWSNSLGNVTTDTSWIVSDKAEYYVEVTDENNCIGRDTVWVDTRETELTAEFLMASSVPVGDTLIIIEVSQPKPQSFEWYFSGKHRIVEKSNFLCKVIFEEEGNYEAILNAQSDNCTAQARKTILVTPEVNHNVNEDGNQTVSQSIISLVATPNPNKGYFQAKLKLNEVLGATYYLVRIENGQIIEKRKVNGLDTYNEDFNVNAPGIYAVFIEVGQERQVVKVIVE